jgi:hypothetical protein
MTPRTLSARSRRNKLDILARLNIATGELKQLTFMTCPWSVSGRISLGFDWKSRGSGPERSGKTYTPDGTEMNGEWNHASADRG